jgi:very-short-patch-repair endonuclease
LSKFYKTDISEIEDIAELLDELLEFHQEQADIDAMRQELEQYPTLGKYISTMQSEENILDIFCTFNKIFGKNASIKKRQCITLRAQYNLVSQAIGNMFNFFGNANFKDAFETKKKNIFDSFSQEISQKPIRKLIQYFQSCIQNKALMADYIDYNKTIDDLRKSDLKNWIDEIEKKQIPVNTLKESFLLCFYESWLRETYNQCPELQNFNTNDQKDIIERFIENDKKFIKNSRYRLRHRLLQSIDSLNNSRDMVGAKNILKREKEKKRKLKSIRQLFSEIYQLILKLKPCVMMSPLAVSTYLSSVPVQFDLVIFDEASQIPPYEAITAIYRGKQLLVAGDTKQLPPTSFFKHINSDVDSDDNDDSLENYDSILHILRPCLATNDLSWHYRSKREQLIEFSNKVFYEGKLITFPSIKDEENNRAIKFEYVADGRWESRSGTNGGGYNMIEAKKTAELIIKFAEDMPNKSLGVITLNKNQQEKVEAALEELRRQRPDLETFFSEDSDDEKSEPFFIKNLENVQGDERDYIFLCIGFGKTKEGKTSMNFGPINQQDGEYRLNVAVTRAKYGMTVISSIHYLDIDLARVSNDGPKHLRAYLELAETGKMSGTRDNTGGVEPPSPESPFEEAVADALRGEGFEVRLQIGCSSYRIDLALMDPDVPGRYVLGVECDGATYHSSKTARDRDRLRQDVLESLGWTIHRIWSTDWIKNSKREVEQVKKAFNEAKKKI